MLRGVIRGGKTDKSDSQGKRVKSFTAIKANEAAISTALIL